VMQINQINIYLSYQKKNIQEEEQHIEQQFLKMAMEQEQFLFLFLSLYLYLYHAGLKEVKQPNPVLHLQADARKQEQVEGQQGGPQRQEQV